MNSTIKVEPRLASPELGADTGKPEEAEDFIRSFESMCRLANNGRGMMPSDMVMTIGNCLKKGRKTMYDNIVRGSTENKLMEKNPWAVYSKIKDKILQHTETLREKQIRVRAEWHSLVRFPSEPILDFEARWEDKCQKMQRAGLDRTKDEMLIDYLNKIGEG